MSFAYRVFEESDLPGCLELWRENTDWGEVTAEQWRSWYIDMPYGPAIIVVAVDQDNRVVGQEVFSPVEFQLGQRRLRALRLSAPILKRDMRLGMLRNQDHPMIGLFRVGLAHALAMGFSLMYALPSRGWLPFFRWGAQLGLEHFTAADQAEYGCLALQLMGVPGDAGSDRDIHCEVIKSFGDEYTTLWQEACLQMPIACGVVREPPLLNFRNGGHLNFAVKRGQELLGFVALKPQAGLIVDLLARNEDDLRTVVAESLRYMSQHRSSLSIPDEIKSIDTPYVGPVLRELGFHDIDFQFALACYSLDPTVSRDELSVQRWFITAGD